MFLEVLGTIPPTPLFAMKNNCFTSGYCKLDSRIVQKIGPCGPQQGDPAYEAQTRLTSRTPRGPKKSSRNHEYPSGYSQEQEKRHQLDTLPAKPPPNWIAIKTGTTSLYTDEQTPRTSVQTWHHGCTNSVDSVTYWLFVMRISSNVQNHG